MSKSSHVVVSARSAHKYSARLRANSEKQIKRAVARLEQLETRQLLSTNPFVSGFAPFHAHGQSVAVATAIGDVNGDGVPDFVALNASVGSANGTISIFNGVGDGHQGTGQFAYSQKISAGMYIPVAAFSNNIVVATLGNGHPDIIVSSSSSDYVEVIQGNGHGGFSPAQRVQVTTSGTYVDSITVADVNGDSVPDLITGDSGGYVSVALGQAGTSQFSSYVNYNIGLGGGYVKQVAVADVNGDGLPDIIFNYTSGPHDSEVGLLLNNGNFNLEELTSPFVGSSPLAAYFGTVDYHVESFAVANMGTYGDKPEIVLLDYQNAGNYTVAVLAAGYNTSFPQYFGLAQEFTIGANGNATFAKVNVGDINGDGVPDVLVTQYGQQTSGFYAYVYGFKTESSFPYTVSTTPQYATSFDNTYIAPGAGLTFGDTNGDGETDVVVGYYATSGGKAYTQFYSLLTEVESVPAITSAPTTTFLQDSGSNSFTVTASGNPDALITSPDLPDGLTLSDNLDGTGTLTGSPTAGPGVYTFTLEAANPAGQDFQTFTLTVDAPPNWEVSTGAVNAEVGIPVLVTADLNDSGTTGYPIDNETITLSSGTLPTGMIFTDTGDGTSLFSGTPAVGTGGVYIVTLTASNGITPDAVLTVTITVDEAPSFTSAAAATFTVGSNGSFDIAAQTGYPTAGTTITLDGSDTTLLTSLGLSLTDNGNGTAEIFGNPPPGAGGTYTVTLTATNTAALTATQMLVITIDEAPVFSGPKTATFTDGVNSTFDIDATGGFPTVGTVISVTSGDVPNGMNFVSNGDGTATLSGSPAAGDFGVYDVTVTAVNAADLSTSENLVFTVDQPPVFTSGHTTTFTVGIDGNFDIETTGFPTAGTMSITGGTLPTGVTLIDNGDGTGKFVGTPAAGTGGTYVLELGFTNGVSPDATQTFVLTVDQAPAFVTGDTATFTVGTAGTFAIATTEFPTAGTTITVDGSDATLLADMGLTLTDNGNGTATITGTPPSDSPLGPQTITLTASNGVSPDAVQVLTITIDKAPSFTNSTHASFTVGDGNTFDIDADSGFPTDGETIGITGVQRQGEATTLPAGLTFTDNGDGTATISGTPAPGTGGYYQISLVANNGVQPNATQTLNISIFELPKFLSASSYTFAVGVSSSFAVQASGHDKPDLSASGLPAGLTFTDDGDGNGTISGIPTKNEVGTYGVVITAENDTGTVEQSFQLNIVKGTAAKITSAKTANFNVGQAGAFTITSTGGPSPSLALEIGTLPTGLTFVDNGNGTGFISGTPAPGTQGVYTFTVVAHNGISKDATQTFTLNVHQPSLFTSAAGTTFTAGIAGNFTVVSTGILQAKLSVSGKLPAGLSFHDNGNGTATIAATSALQAGGVYHFVITAGNSTEKITQNFTLTVNQPPSLKGFFSAPNVNLTHNKFKETKFTIAGYPNSFSVSDVAGLPTGTLSLSVSGDTLILEGTPTETGLYTVTFHLTDGSGTSDLSIILNIN